MKAIKYEHTAKERTQAAVKSSRPAPGNELDARIYSESRLPSDRPFLTCFTLKITPNLDEVARRLRREDVPVLAHSG